MPLPVKINNILFLEHWLAADKVFLAFMRYKYLTSDISKPKPQKSYLFLYASFHWKIYRWVAEVSAPPKKKSTKASNNSFVDEANPKGN